MRDKSTIQIPEWEGGILYAADSQVTTDPQADTATVWRAMEENKGIDPRGDDAKGIWEEVREVTPPAETPKEAPKAKEPKPKAEAKTKTKPADASDLAGLTDIELLSAMLVQEREKREALEEKVTELDRQIKELASLPFVLSYTLHLRAGAGQNNHLHNAGVVLATHEMQRGIAAWQQVFGTAQGLNKYRRDNELETRTA